jgi:hypothetical protein
VNASFRGLDTVEDDDRANLKKLDIRFVDADGEEHRSRSEDGSFTARLSPGHYNVQVDASGDLIPKSIRSEDTDTMQEGLTVSHSGKAPLEIALSHDGATIEGIAQETDGEPFPGATVVLIPETKLRSRHGLYRETSTDQFGRYHFGVNPRLSCDAKRIRRVS